MVKVGIINSKIYQHLQHGIQVSSYTINRICALLQCQSGDIMEWVPDGANRRSLPVKKNRPVKDIYIIYIGRDTYSHGFLPSAPCACALSPSGGSGCAYAMYCIVCRLRAAAPILRDAHCTMYNVCYAMDDVQRMMYII